MLFWKLGDIEEAFHSSSTLKIEKVRVIFYSGVKSRESK